MDKEITIDKKVTLSNIENKIKSIPQPSQAEKNLYAVASKRFSDYSELTNGEAIMMSDRCTVCKICE